jgi:benzodiazapine receptor
MLKISRILNMVSFLLLIATIVVVNLLPFGGLRSDEVLARFETLFNPSKFFFIAIWILVLVLLLVFSIYQVMPGQKNNSRLDGMGGWFIFINLLLIGWVIAWQMFEFIIGLILIMAVLILAIVLYEQMRVGRTGNPVRERWLVDLPLGSFLGWISIMTVLCTAFVLLDQNWSGFGWTETGWTVSAIGYMVLLTVYVIFKRNAVFFPMIVILALVGIALNGLGDRLVSNTAWISAGLVLLLLGIARSFVRRKQLINRYKK